MNEQNYEIILSTRGPVHISSGDLARKKEYVCNTRQKKIEFLNMRAFNQLILKENLSDYYHSFILSNNGDGLFEFIQEHKLQNKYQRFILYSMDISSLSFRKGKNLNDINLTLKDPYYKPYIPGSSLKGALLQNILYYAAFEQRNRLQDKYIEKLKSIRRQSDWKKKRFQKSMIEKELLNELSRYILRKHDNPDFKTLGSLISIGDSNTISPSKLILSQKLDISILDPENSRKDRKNTLNLIRESIPRNETFTFPLKLKEPEILSIEHVKESIEQTFNSLDEVYRSMGGFDELVESSYLYLGAGTGFISKTLLYGLMDLQDAVNYSSYLLEDEFKKIRRHIDRKVALAPKTIKKGITSDGNQELGLCKIQFREV